MNKMFLAVLFLALGVSAGTIGAWAQNSDAAANADHTAPSYDMKAQSLFDLGTGAEKVCGPCQCAPGRQVDLASFSGLAFVRRSISSRSRRALRDYQVDGSYASGRIR